MGYIEKLIGKDNQNKIRQLEEKIKYLEEYKSKTEAIYIPKLEMLEYSFKEIENINSSKIQKLENCIFEIEKKNNQLLKEVENLKNIIKMNKIRSEANNVANLLKTDEDEILESDKNIFLQNKKNKNIQNEYEYFVKELDETQLNTLILILNGEISNIDENILYDINEKSHDIIGDDIINIDEICIYEDYILEIKKIISI
ncbi:MAG: hypothetical protein FWF57_06380 [Defluviitaleaceae bacterium]|nr:hypothetical protein [Defluviitaleaceae bacterium]